MHDWPAMLREFQITFNHERAVPDAPAVLDRQRQNQRLAYMQEELDEFAAAETLLDQADAMIDLIYFALGTLTEMGVDPDELFTIVHQANMTKLWPDGRPHYNADDKVIKPPGWRSPDAALLAVLEKQGCRPKNMTVPANKD